ncbi:MAG: tetratricopeptide repeat protein [Chloroflexi bacterium]|nr:tetratricopeptide repeat protein [Chloroflexota bacterium]
MTERLVQRVEEEEPQWGALLRAAAIPRRLDTAVVGVLRGAPDDDAGNQAALQRLTALSFVLPDPEGESYTLHEETRSALLEDWQIPERRPQYVALSQALWTHFQGRDPLEALYHRFVVDPEAAFDEFEQRIQNASGLYHQTACGALIITAEEQSRELDTWQRLWVLCYRAPLARVGGMMTLPPIVLPSELLHVGSLTSSAEILLDAYSHINAESTLEQFERFAHAADELREKGGDWIGCAIALLHLGDRCLEVGRLESARKYYEQSRRVIRPLVVPEQRHNEAVAIYALGLADLFLGDEKKALDEHERATELFARAQTHWQVIGNKRLYQLCERALELIEGLRRFVAEALSRGGKTMLEVVEGEEELFGRFIRDHDGRIWFLPVLMHSSPRIIGEERTNMGCSESTNAVG